MGSFWNPQLRAPRLGSLSQESPGKRKVWAPESPSDPPQPGWEGGREEEGEQRWVWLSPVGRSGALGVLEPAPAAVPWEDFSPLSFPSFTLAVSVSDPHNSPMAGDFRHVPM